MSTAVELSSHVKAEIDRWRERFPEDRQRSAVIGALHAVQHENHGYLTAEDMNAQAGQMKAFVHILITIVKGGMKSALSSDLKQNGQTATAPILIKAPGAAPKEIISS